MAETPKKKPAAGKAKKRLINILVVLGLLFLFAPVYMNANKPNIICVACHESRNPYLSWRTSTHRDQICTDCHNAPNSWKMVALHFVRLNNNWEKQREHSFKTCVRCHKKITGVVYFHSIKFPHEAHRKYTDDCRLCHINVVHGSRIEYRNPPKKEVCATCHKGVGKRHWTSEKEKTRWSEKCYVCHLKFTKALPQQLDPKWIASHSSDVKRFSKACKECHKDKQFCTDCHKKVNPHDKKWMKSHRKIARKATRTCETCHTWRDCNRCHQVLERHQNDWYDGHRIAARKDAENCKRCHDKKFCDSCHGGITAHPRNWIKGHRTAPDAMGGKQCSTCHPSKYCANCHEGKHALHHEGNWLSNHGDDVKAEGRGSDVEACISCHAPNFCLSCHKGVRKNVHARNYGTMHANVSPQTVAQCKKCHTQETCNACHKAKLPVDHKNANWKSGHGLRAIGAMDSCMMCHEKPFCEACHNKKVPISHEAKNWGSAHGAAGQQKDSRCSLCHDDKFCNTCHSRKKPTDHYKDNWKKAHGNTAVFDMNKCSACHDQKDCKKCHEYGAEHRSTGWMKNHDVSRKNQSFGQCTQCHGLTTCIDCHEKHNIGGHAKCAGCHTNINNPKKIKASPCNDCHHKMPTTATHKKHEAVDCDSCHKPHGMIPQPTACATCHDKGKDHTMGNPCLECHSFK